MKASVQAAGETFGGLDVMYHNAAANGSNAEIDEMSVEEWDDSQALLVRASFLAIKVSVPALRARGGGAILLTSSTASFNIKRGSSVPYVTGKAAIPALCRIAALRHAQDNIRVNAIVPGGIGTPIHLRKMNLPEDVVQEMLPEMERRLFAKFQPLPIAGRAADVAAAALFLASDEARWITGVALAIDGGLSLSRGVTDEERDLILDEIRSEALARAAAHEANSN